MVAFYPPITPFVIQESANLNEGLNRLKETNGLPLVVVDKYKTLVGILSTGDIARYLEKQNIVNIKSCTISEIANKNPILGHSNDTIETVKGYLSSSLIRTLPIVDYKRKLIKIVTSSEPKLQIDNVLIGKEEKPFIIAEIGVNHNGYKEEAKYLIDEAYKANFNAIKFQHRSNDLYDRKNIDTFDLGTQYIISEIDRTKLSIEDLKECCLYAKGKGISVIVTPFDKEALKEIELIMDNISALKIASCDLMNHELINLCINKNKPLIISTGMSYEHEIIQTSQLLLGKMCEHAFLHCCSTYPAPLEDINLNYIDRLHDITEAVIGYSSHDGQVLIPYLAIAKGADIIEVHITRSHSQKGTDHKASIPVNKLNEFINSCTDASVAKGHVKPRKPSQGELANKISLGKSLALKKEKKAGEIVNNQDLYLVSPGIGYGPNEKLKVIGKKLIRDKRRGSLLRAKDLSSIQNNDIPDIKSINRSLEKNGYEIGIPVRYHDIRDLSKIFIFPMLEFHMSDRDLRLDPDRYLDKKFIETNMIVHGIEQFEDGFIFDLASHDEDIIKRSLEEIERLNNHINKLKKYFKNEKIPVVINLGGHSDYKFNDLNIADKKLNNVIKNFEIIRNKYPLLEFLPQTMPPYPWHQGGRSYHNILTNYKYIEKFLSLTDSDICLDVSHTYLSANFWGEDFIDYIKLLGNRIKHIHLADASGINGEGLEIGDGTINFKSFHETIKTYTKKCFLVPEIWQGHMNNGIKFFNALNRFNEIIN